MRLTQRLVSEIVRELVLVLHHHCRGVGQGLVRIILFGMQRIDNALGVRFGRCKRREHHALGPVHRGLAAYMQQGRQQINGAGCGIDLHSGRAPGFEDHQRHAHHRLVEQRRDMAAHPPLEQLSVVGGEHHPCVVKHTGLLKEVEQAAKLVIQIQDVFVVRGPLADEVLSSQPV